MTPRIPVTLVTGYLGAGKTTFVNALLADASAGRLAVIVNEFGDIGLDHDLIVDTSEETVLLQSGCLCCTVRGDLVEALEGLLERRARGEIAFDRIVIETTGLADPAPILHTMIVAPHLGGMIRMDGVVTLCDAVNGPQTLDNGFESVQQVAMADVLVLSKTDLVSPGNLAAFRARLAALAPAAEIVTAEHGRIDLAQVFGKGAPDIGDTVPQALDWASGKAVPGAGLAALPSGLSGFAAAAPGPLAAPVPAARHDARITSVSVAFDAPVHPVMLSIWLDTLIGKYGPDILRIKAVVWAHGVGTPYVIHGVQHIVEAPVQLATWHGTNGTSRIVVIGRDLPREAILESIDTLRIMPVAHSLPS